MEITLLYLISGVLAGTVAGLLPGIGLTATMVVLGGFLFGIEPIYSIVFYLGMLCASQYIGSMVAICFGVPGEASSMPAVKEGYSLFLKGQASTAIGTTAIGSFIGSIMAAIIFFMIFPVIQNLFLIWNTNIHTSILIFALFMVIAISTNKLIVSLLTIFVGANLGLTGANFDTGIEWLTFNQPILFSGLPVIPILMGIFVLPELLKAFDAKPNNSNLSPRLKLNINENIRLAKQNIGVMTYSSVVGFFAGVVPMLTVKLASNLSYSIECWRQQRKKTYTQGNLSCLISAETSNNAACFSSMLPLLFFGIPVVTSEYVLYDYITTSPTIFNIDYVVQHLDTLAISYVLINIFCLLLAWPFANICLALYRLPYKVLRIFSLFLVIFPVVYLGYRQDLTVFFIAVFLFASAIGLLFKKYDTLPMTFSFLLVNEFAQSFIRFYQINF